MYLHFLGGAREVGRSAVLVEGSKNLLLDCGVKLGENEEYPLLDRSIIKRINRVVVSHAHLDHSGYLPALYAFGYNGKITTTKPTRDLIQLLLADYLRLKQDFSPYSQEDVIKCLKHTDILEYDRGTEIVLREAGHILGSALTEVEMDGKKIIYTGDINTRPSRLIEAARTDLSGDVLIMESTYGGKSDKHIPAKEAGRMLIDSITQTFNEGGKVLIPTFAIGRGQEILFTLESYLRSGGLEKTPIFLDGMINKALRIYRHNAIYLKDEIKRRILTSEDDPFKSKYYLVPRTKNKEEVFETERAIILTTSGMLNGGPVLGYLEKMAGDRKNKIVLVGYQVEGTRGRKLLEGEKSVQIDDHEIEVKMKVDLAPFTAHSDHSELVKFVRSTDGLKKVILVHGEGRKPFELAEELELVSEKRRHQFEVIVPELGEEIRI